MIGQLEVIAGADRGRIFPLSPGAPLVIGRGRQTVTRLKDLHVSRVHCQIEVRGADVILKDLNSVGGTLVNSHPVTEHLLRSGDVIQLGETKLRFQSAHIADQNTLPPVQPGEHVPFAVECDAPVPEASLEAVIPLPDAMAAALPLPEHLPEAIPITDSPPAVRPPITVLKVLPGERLGELAGSTLAHFRIGEVCAKGKSGVVFRAVNLKTHREVALKVLRPEFTREEKEVQRFIRSMKTMLPLRHPNLVTLYGAGKKGRYCWIAMEYVAGESLSQVIQRIGVAGMLDWRHAFRIAVHIARALDFAHRRHIVHRNMTPQNVLVRQGDLETKLGDLMLAKATEGSLAEQITRANEMLGDLRYMSPEQTFGPDRMDARSDIYSLGGLLYATLTGQPPFQASTLLETITQIRQASVVIPKVYQMSIPDGFQAVILRMLAKRPEDRYQTAHDLLHELERVAKYQGLPPGGSA